MAQEIDPGRTSRAAAFAARGLLGAKLPISFQFHHVQMDGQQAAQFLSRLQWAMLHPGRKGGPAL